MIDGALPYLRCPVCEDTVARADARTLRCPRGHSFDVAKQGYVNLTTGRMPHSGDSAEMIADRCDFLADGHYDFIAHALAVPAERAATAGRAATADGAAPAGGLVVDAGTGTGWYLAHVLDASPGTIGLGIDVSKPALRRAARAHPRAGAVLADLWGRLPVADDSASLLLNVFAPRNAPEFRRVLRPDGRLLVITPAADHLAELISAFGLIRVDPDKADRVTESLGSHFVVEHSTTHRHTMRLTGDRIRTLIGMTPSARHVAVQDLPEDVVSVTAAVDVTAYRPV